MNRLDFSEILKSGHDLNDYAKNIEAIDSVYHLLATETCINNIDWINKSKYDLTFKITLSEPRNFDDIDIFTHLRKYMELIIEPTDNKSITYLHIQYKSNSRC